MKIFKRILSCLLVQLLLLTAAWIPVSAAVNGEAGGTVTVVFTFENCYSVSGVFSISNTEILEGYSYAKGDASFEGTVSSSTGKVELQGNTCKTYTVVCTVKLKESASIGDSCTISFKGEITVPREGYEHADPPVTVPISMTPSETVTVKTKKVDYTELQAQIDAASKLKSTDYTAASWSALVAALNQAKTLQSSQSQSAVDAAAQKLKEAMEGLEKPQKANTEVLETQIRSAERLVEADYTPESWKNLTVALKEAKALLDSQSQSAVDLATSKLKSAMAGLVKLSKVNHDGLMVQIDAASRLNQADYTAASWNTLMTALNEAKKLTNSQSQSAVDQGTNKLKSAIAGLVRLSKVNYSGLQMQIDAANRLNSGDYTAASWSTLVAALNEAKALFSSQSQSAVDAGANKLRSAISGLVRVSSVDYTELNRQIGIASALKKGQYTDASWNAMVTAYNAALALRSESRQNIVDAGAQRLKKAISELQTVGDTVDYTELNRQISIAEALVKAEYTDSSWELLQAALEAAKALQKDPSQSNVDVGAKTLKDAIAALVQLGAMDYTELNRQIEIAGSIRQDGYTAESWTALVNALEAAKALQTGDDQAAINEGAAALRDAVAALQKVSYDALQAALEETRRYLSSGELSAAWERLYTAIDAANDLLQSGDQAAVDQAAAQLLQVLEQLKQAMADNSTEVIKEVFVETEPTSPYCNISSHTLWIILFAVSAALNLFAVGFTVFGVLRRRSNQRDDMPLVDYQIGDDD